MNKEPIFPINPEESDVVGIKLKFQIYIDNDNVTHYTMQKNGVKYDVPYRTDGSTWNPTYPDFSDYYFENIDPISYEEIYSETGYKLTGETSKDISIMNKNYG